MKHSRTDDKALSLMLKAMIAGATLEQLRELMEASEATVYRYLNMLSDVYQVEWTLSENLGNYKIIDVGKDNIWRVVFRSLP